MPEVEIIRKAIFIVDHAEFDEEYGRLIVTDKEGNTHTINKKHDSLHTVFEDGMAVEVGYGSYMNKEFIHTARQVKDALPKPVATPDKGTTSQTPDNAPKIAPQQPTVPIKPPSRDDNIERQVAWKEIGELIRTFPKSYPNLEEKYFAWLVNITGAAPFTSADMKWLKKLNEIKPDLREKVFVNLPKIVEKLSKVE